MIITLLLRARGYIIILLAAIAISANGEINDNTVAFSATDLFDSAKVVVSVSYRAIRNTPKWKEDNPPLGFSSALHNVMEYIKRGQWKSLEFTAGRVGLEFIPGSGDWIYLVELNPKSVEHQGTLPFIVLFNGAVISPSKTN